MLSATNSNAGTEDFQCIINKQADYQSTHWRLRNVTCSERNTAHSGVIDSEIAVLELQHRWYHTAVKTISTRLQHFISLMKITQRRFQNSQSYWSRESTTKETTN